MKKQILFINLKKKFDVSLAGEELLKIDMGNLTTKGYSQSTIDTEKVKDSVSIGFNSIDFDLEFNNDITETQITSPITITGVTAKKKNGKNDENVKISNILKAANTDIQINPNEKTQLQISGLSSNTTYSSIEVNYQYKNADGAWENNGKIDLGQIKTHISPFLITLISIIIILIILLIAIAIVTLIILRINKNKERQFLKSI